MSDVRVTTAGDSGTKTPARTAQDRMSDDLNPGYLKVRMESGRVVVWRRGRDWARTLRLDVRDAQILAFQLLRTVETIEARREAEER